VRSASIEALTPPRRGPPRSRAQPRSSSKVRLARGLSTPSGGVRLARGHPHTRCPRSCPRVRAFNALTPQDARHNSDTPRNHAPVLFRQLPRGNPSPPLFSAMRQGRCQLRDTVPPTPVRLMRCALEGEPAAPSNVFSVLMQGHAVTSGRRDRSSPSLSALCDHPRHCCTTPNTVATSRRCWGARGQDIATTATVPQRVPVNGTLESARYGGQSTNRYTAALEAAPVRAQDAPRRLNRSGIRQDGRQLHNATRHTSTHRETVWHACKLISPWPIKGWAVPQPRGHRGRRTAITHTLSAFPTTLAFASINTSGTWRPCLLSHLACSHPSTSTTVQAIQCPEHITAGRTAPVGTRIIPVSISC
jgi:hypothetical protein